MKTKLKTIVAAREAAQRLAGMMLPAQASYRTAKLINALNAELIAYDSERVKLCERFGTLNKAEGKYTITDVDEFQTEHTALLDTEIELAVEKVTLPGSISITPTDLIYLTDYVQIEGVEND